MMITTGPGGKLALSAAAAAALALLSGCQTGRSVSTLSTTIGGLHFQATVDGPAFIQAQGDKALLTFRGRTLVVDKERLLLDGKELVKVPPRAARVDIEVQEGRLKVAIDGAGVFSGPLPR